MEKVETFGCGAAKPSGIGPASSRGARHQRTAQPLIQPPWVPDPLPGPVFNRHTGTQQKASAATNGRRRQQAARRRQALTQESP